MSPTRSGRSLGLVLGVAADAAIGDPRRGHPVALFGRAAAAVEHRVWVDSRRRGAAFVAGWVGAVTVLAALTERVVPPTPAHPIGSRVSAKSVAAATHAAVVATTTWAVLGGSGLAREGTVMAVRLERGDLAGARNRLPHLCGRDPSTLDLKGLARATVESVAENTSDAVVAPLWWGAIAGVPGLLGYRVVNTLDAMVGHKSPRHARFGWAAARVDDAANLVPARLTGLLAVALAPLVGGSPRRAFGVLLRYGGHHPSPNAGRCEAAFAGALDRQLGGRNAYGDRVEDRGVLGDGPPPDAGDLARAVRLSHAVTVVATGLAALGALGVQTVRRRFR